MRDVIEVLVIPSLDRALEQLNQKHGRRAVARILVEQSVEQLRLMLEPTKEAVAAAREKMVAAGGTAATSISDSVDGVAEPVFTEIDLERAATAFSRAVEAASQGTSDG